MTDKPETARSPKTELDGEIPCLSRSRIVRAQDLLQGHRELRILHGDEVYRLLLTRNNKLILQK